MNAPERFELFVVPDGVSKFTLSKDTRLPHAATLSIQREDHTLGHLLRASLLQQPQVRFAGSKVPHPLEHVVEVRVQTDGSIMPRDAIRQASIDCQAQIASIEAQFMAEVQRWRSKENDW